MKKAIYMHNDQLSKIVNYDANPSYEQIFNNSPISDNQSASWYTLDELKTSKLLTIDKLIILVRYFEVNSDNIADTVYQILRKVYNFKYIPFDYNKLYRSLTNKQKNDRFFMDGVTDICEIESKNLCITYMVHAIHTAMINNDKKYMTEIDQLLSNVFYGNI